MEKVIALLCFIYGSVCVSYGQAGISKKASIHTVQDSLTPVSDRLSQGQYTQKHLRSAGELGDSVKQLLSEVKSLSLQKRKDSLNLLSDSLSKKMQAINKETYPVIDLQSLKGKHKIRKDSLHAFTDRQIEHTDSLSSKLKGLKRALFKKRSSLSKDSLASLASRKPSRDSVFAAKKPRLALFKRPKKDQLSLDSGSRASRPFSARVNRDSLIDTAKNAALAGVKKQKDRLPLKTPDLSQLKERVAAKLHLAKDTSDKKQLAAALINKKKEELQLAALKDKANSVLKGKKTIPFGLGLGYGSMYLPQRPFGQKSLYSDVFSISADFQIAKIPINLDLSQRYNSDAGFAPLEANLFKFDFDRKRYNNLFRSDADRLKDFKKEKLGGLDISSYTQKNIRAKLRNIPGTDIIGQNPSFASYLKSPDKVNELLKLDEIQLRQKLSQLINVSGKANLKDSLKTKNLSAEKTNTKEIKQSIDSVVSVITTIKKDLQASGLSAEKVEVYQKYLSGKRNLDDVDEDMLHALERRPGLNRAQSLLSRIKSLETGSFATRVPGSSLNNEQFVKGADLVVITRRGPVRVGFGAQDDISMPKDAGTENSAYSPSRYLSYLSVTTHRASFGTGKVSWVGLFNRQQDAGSYSINSLPRSSMAFTVSQDLNMKKLGLLTVELSKSASQYRNVVSPYNENLYLDKGVLNNYFSDELLGNLSMGFNHAMEIKPFGLTQTLYFNYAGLGYQNPGTPGITNLRMRYGGSLKKSLLQNKLSISVKGDLKQTPLTSSTSGAYWRNYQFQADSRYRLGRSSTLSLKYLDNGMDRVDEVSSPMYASRKLQASGSTRYKIGKSYSFSQLSVAGQDLSNSALLTTTSGIDLTANGFSDINSQLLTMNYSQTVLIKKYTVNATVFYNKEITGLKLIGDMLNSELGCQYPLMKNLSLNSALTFFDNKTIARQAGIRQGVDFSPASDLQISATVDLKKNLITPLYPGLYSTGRGEISLKYYLKNY